MMVGVAGLVLNAPSAYASVTCTPGHCVIAGTTKVASTASFTMTPSDASSAYRGSITANLGDTVTKKGNFTDTFNFTLPTDGVGGVAVTTVAATFKGATDLDFTSVLINGAAASISKTLNGIVEIAFASGVSLSAGANSIVVNGVSRGNGSYGGSIAFTPSVPETATWGMMILGFVGMGAAMRHRRKSLKVAFG
jgi:hypothetical protein